MKATKRCPTRSRLRYVTLFLVIAILVPGKTGLCDHSWLDSVRNETFEQITLVKILDSSNGLKLDFPQSYQSAFGQISKLQFNRSSGGGGPLSWKFDGEIHNEVFASYGYGVFNQQQTRIAFEKDGIALANFEATFVVQIREQNAPNRDVLVAARENGYIFVGVESRQNDGYFHFEISPNHGVRCRTTDTGAGNEFSAPTFTEFCRKFPEVVSDTIQPTFNWLGLGEIPSVYSKTTRQMVLNSIAGPSPERISQFKELVAGMDANTFKQREEASKKLEDNFEEWLEMIDWAVNAGDFSPEVKRRLEKIAQSKSDPTKADRRRSVLRGNLIDDPDYLIWLLGDLKPADNSSDSTKAKAAIIQTLSRLTGEKFGDDVVAWKNWASKNSADRNSKTENKPAQTAEEDRDESQTPPATREQVEFMSLPPAQADDFFANNVVSKRGASDIRLLVPLRIGMDGKLILDESQWSAPYNDQPVEDVISKVEKVLKRENLPSQWFQPGGEYSKQTTSHVHLLFAKLSGAFGVGNGSRSIGFSQNVLITHNRKFNHRGLVAGQMNFHEDNGRKFGMRGAPLKDVPGKDYFQLEISSARFPFENVVIRHFPKKSLSIMVSAIGLGRRFSLFENYDPQSPSCTLYVREGGQITNLKAKDFNSLSEKHAEHLNDSIAPKLKKFGIELPPFKEADKK